MKYKVYVVAYLSYEIIADSPDKAKEIALVRAATNPDPKWEIEDEPELIEPNKYPY